MQDQEAAAEGREGGEGQSGSRSRLRTACSALGTEVRSTNCTIASSCRVKPARLACPLGVGPRSDEAFSSARLGFCVRSRVSESSIGRFCSCQSCSWRSSAVSAAWARPSSARRGSASPTAVLCPAERRVDSDWALALLSACQVQPQLGWMTWVSSLLKDDGDEALLLPFAVICSSGPLNARRRAYWLGPEHAGSFKRRGALPPPPRRPLRPTCSPSHDHASTASRSIRFSELYMRLLDRATLPHSASTHGRRSPYSSFSRTCLSLCFSPAQTASTKTTRPFDTV